MRSSGGRWIAAVVMALVAFVGYLGTRQVNPVTGESQHVDLTPDQEIALGLQAAPQMEAEHGGPSQDPRAQGLVSRVGERLVSSTIAGRGPYRFQFHLLGDRDTINAFALPGGQVFITEGLARRLHSEGELAGVLAHEVGHVIERHSAQHLAKARLIQGLGGAAVIAGADPEHPGRSYASQAVAAAVAQLVNLKFSRNDEVQSDQMGVKLMSDAGYDPRSMIGVMQVLQESARRGRNVEFLSTHPSPENRIPRIKEAIQAQFPGGVPPNLQR
jgi:predicted Zn-dependent protease